MTGETEPARPWWRRDAKWLLGALLVLDLGLVLFALSFANATAEGPAKRSLRHSIAILTEIDAVVDDHFEALQQEAARTQQGALSLPDFPIDVELAPGEVRLADREAFRALLLDRAAERIYEKGMSAFQEDQHAGESYFSAPGIVRGGMDLLRATPHNVLSALTIALAAVAAALAVGLALASRGYGRLLALGVSISLAAVPFLMLAMAARFTLRLAADGLDDYLAREFLELAQELSWAPIRNGIIFSIGGAVTLLSGIGLARWSDGRTSRLST